MGKDDVSSNNSESSELQKKVQDQANDIAKLENEIKKISDPNKTPKIIQKGEQRHPKYERNDKQIPATLPKETDTTKE